MFASLTRQIACPSDSGITKKEEKMKKYAHVILVTDCGGSDRGRYEIAAQRCFFPHDLRTTFFETHSMNTLHAGFITAAHALSTVDHFGSLKKGERIGILDNAAPRHGNENGKKLRGEKRKAEGEEIYALLLDNDVWVVGPNAGFNFHFLQSRVRQSYLVTDTSGMITPFRSMEVMVPALSKVLGITEWSNIEVTEKSLVVGTQKPGLYVADWDKHGNMYIVSVGKCQDWLPKLGESRVFNIGDKIARLRCVDGIFAGNTGEPTLTTGSLKLNGESVHYMVVVGSNARALFDKPSVGAEVIIERE